MPIDFKSFIASSQDLLSAISNCSSPSSWDFYLPSFIIATILGGSVALIFLKTLQKSKVLYTIQKKLGVNVYEKSKKNS